MVDVIDPQFHDDIDETSCKAASSARKSARLSSNAPEVFEVECGSDSSLRPLSRRRRRLADDETLPEIYEIAEDETPPELHETVPEMYEIAQDESTKTPWVYLTVAWKCWTQTIPCSTRPCRRHLRMRRVPEEYEITDGIRRSGQPYAHTVPAERDGEARKVVRNPTAHRDGNPSSDMVHCGGNLQRLENLAVTENDVYQCVRNPGRNLRLLGRGRGR